MQKLRDFFRNRWFKFALTALCYLLWVMWMGSYWWLLGLIIVFDIYITTDVPEGAAARRGRSRPAQRCAPP